MTSCHLSAWVQDTAWWAKLSPCASTEYGFILNSLINSWVIGKLPWWDVKWCGSVLFIDSCFKSTYLLSLLLLLVFALSFKARLHRNWVTWSELNRVEICIGAQQSHFRFKSSCNSSWAHCMIFTKSYLAQKFMKAYAWVWRLFFSLSPCVSLN